VPVAVEALKKGAADFIEKPFNDNHLVDTVIACLAKYAGQLGESQEKARIHLRLQSLSEREAEVLKLMLEGRLNKQIADDLTISMRTVEVHRARILAKMQARNAVELAAQLSSLGLDPK
jgi:two-component system response regulator DctR